MFGNYAYSYLGGGGDRYRNNVSLLFHFDNATVDKSKYGHSIALGSGFSYTNSNLAFGTHSGNFGTTPSYLDIADHSSLEMGSEDFTIECYIRPATITTQYIYHKKSTAGEIAGVNLFLSSGRLTCEATVTGINWTVQLGDPDQLTANTWYHVAVVRSGSNWSLYRGGALVDQASQSGNVTASTGSLTIGQLMSTSTGSRFTGHIDELRVTKGAARYTGSTYTQPTSAFPDT